MSIYTTPVGQVRLLISDIGTEPLLSDDILEGYLAFNGYDGVPTNLLRPTVLRAAANALDAIATSETLVSKKIRTQDLSTDGPAVAADLRKHATALMGQARDEEDDAAVIFDFIAPGGSRPSEGSEWYR